MRKKERGHLAGTNEAEELDSLNADTQRRRNAPERIRRKLEATIEAKAKKRRGREVPASAAWRR